MLGAIVGDIVGSIYEFNNIKTKDFPLFSDKCEFTDDTVMTIAVANALHTYKSTNSISEFSKEVTGQMRRLGNKYPDMTYGLRFIDWLNNPEAGPYNSLGNGSAMRVSSVAWVAGSLEEAEILAEASAVPTHNHPEGIKGAQATAAAIFLARNQKSKNEIKKYISDKYYPLDFTTDSIRDTYKYNETCMDCVPQAIVAFLDSTDFEDAIRNAISIGGDSDTIAAITGSIAEAFYNGVPEKIKSKALSYLDSELLNGYQLFLSLCQNNSQDETQLLAEFLTNSIKQFAMDANKKGWIPENTQLKYIEPLWNTGNMFVAYWLSNPQFIANFNGEKRDIYFNLSTLSLFAGIYYALSYSIDKDDFNVDKIFAELMTGNLYENVATATGMNIEELETYAKEEYRLLYSMISDYDPDEDTAEKLLYQGACAFFHIGCAIELCDLGDI